MNASSGVPSRDYALPHLRRKRRRVLSGEAGRQPRPAGPVRPHPLSSAQTGNADTRKVRPEDGVTGADQRQASSISDPRAWGFAVGAVCMARPRSYPRSRRGLGHLSLLSKRLNTFPTRLMPTALTVQAGAPDPVGFAEGCADRRPWRGPSGLSPKRSVANPRAAQWGTQQPLILGL